MTADEIRRDYALRIAQAEPDARAGLEREMLETIITSQEQDAREREVTGWREAALREFPSAVPAEVVGTTAEAMRAAAEASHGRYEARVTEAATAAREEERQRLMGAAYPGSGGVPPGANAPNVEEAQEAHRRGMFAKVRGAIASHPFSPNARRGMEYGRGIRSEMQSGDPVGKGNPQGLQDGEAREFIRAEIKRGLAPFAKPFHDYMATRYGRRPGGSA